MSNKNYFAIPQSAPICVGTGLLALDIVINEDNKTPPRLWAGGSCGNVLTILSYLGWQSYPIARLGNDTAAQEIRADLTQYQVRLDFVESDPRGCTPIILEKIRLKRDGTPTHRFLLVCPNCGSWFPRYKSILLKKARGILDKLPEIKTFYFDKVSPGAIEIACAARARGSLVVFEPSSIGNETLFQKALRTCHILKYAHERLEGIDKITQEVSPVLQVETLGQEGLRYRIRRGNRHREKWLRIPAFSIERFRDAAGSGDWCTAGIIHVLGQDGSDRFENISQDEIAEGLRFGQALAALNCLFEGARGGMYALTKQDLRVAVEKIMLGYQSGVVVPDTLPMEISNMLEYVCPGCIQQSDRNRNRHQQDILTQNVGLV
jgi:fructokinase